MSRKPPPKIKIYLPPDLHRALKEHSQAHGVSMAHIIRTLVHQDLQTAGPVRECSPHEGARHNATHP